MSGPYRDAADFEPQLGPLIQLGGRTLKCTSMEDSLPMWWWTSPKPPMDISLWRDRQAWELWITYRDPHIEVRVKGHGATPETAWADAVRRYAQVPGLLARAQECVHG
jgi:hypothetical protein